MALPETVQGSTHSALLITCRRKDDSVLDITGATITARMKNKVSGTIEDIAGDLDLVDPTGGQFRWTFDATDLDTVGVFKVQFTATYSDSTIERSIAEDWEVLEAF